MSSTSTYGKTTKKIFDTKKKLLLTATNKKYIKKKITWIYKKKKKHNMKNKIIIQSQTEFYLDSTAKETKYEFDLDPESSKATEVPTVEPEITKIETETVSQRPD